MVRKNNLTPPYRELFGAHGTRTAGASSSSAPGSSVPEIIPDSQASQRVVSQSPLVPQFDAPPAHHDHVPEDAPPLMSVGVHLDLQVPPGAPYAMYTIEDLLAQPRREGLPVLVPD
ncbi:hypothetical protein N665_0945s0007 [Sinapis alba]|nr:hypothetical protein N665_0945s0007 [Sinapis alba]